MNTPPKLGLWSATSLVIGTVVGSGIFMLPAVVARFGGIGIAGWAMSGLGALFLAACFSRLSRRFPKAGGPYAYSRLAFGDLVGFQVAVCYWIRSFVTISAISIACSGYMSSLVPQLLGDPFSRCLMSCALVWLLVGINLMGIKPVGVVQVITSAIKILPLIFMAFFGIFFINGDHFTPFNISGTTNFQAIMAAAAVTFFSFMGLESATIPSDDVERPEKTIPRATLLGTSVVIILYLLSATAVLGIVPLDQLAQSNAPFSLAAQTLLGTSSSVSTLVTVCAIISCLGAINGYLLLQGKLPLAAAQDGLFPKMFTKKNKRGAPWFGLVVCACVSNVLLIMTMSPSVAQQFETVILIAAFLALFVYAYSCVSEIVVTVSDPAPLEKKALFKPTFLGLGAFVYCIWAMGGTGSKIGFLGVVFIVATLPLYIWICWQSARTQKA